MTFTLSTLPRSLGHILWFSLAVYVVVLPIPHSIAVRNIAFAVMLSVTFVALLRSRTKPSFPLALPWLAYSVVALVSVFYAVDGDYSWRNFVAEIGYGTLVFVFAATWGRGRSMLTGLLAILIAFNMVTLVAAALDFPFSNFHDIGSLYSLNPLASVGANANFLILVMPLIGLTAWKLWRLERNWSAISMAALWFLDLGALLLSANRQSLIAVGASVLCAALLLPRAAFTKRRLAALVAVFILISGVALLQMSRRIESPPQVEALITRTVKEDVRWDLWRFSVEKIAEHPWRGAGFGRGAFDRLYADYRPEDTLLWHAHNMVLNRGIQMGLPGIVTFCWLWLALIQALAKKFRDNPQKQAVAITGLSIVTAVILKNMTDDFFFRDPALMFWLIMGIMLGELRRLESSRA